MVAQRTPGDAYGGRIVFSSSVTGIVALPNCSAYAVTKAGLSHMARVLALELGRNGITVNTLGIGATVNERNLRDDPDYEAHWAGVTPTGRCGQPVDAAAALLFLVSPNSSNVRIERYIPQSALLPYVDVCLNHGGYNTVIEPVLHGIPQVVLPLAADQPVLALLCMAHSIAPALPAHVFDLIVGGPGLPVVNPAKLTPAMIRDAVWHALTKPTYRAGARALQTQLMALPGLEIAVERLAYLADRHETVLA